jgi:hypothetical protein
VSDPEPVDVPLLDALRERDLAFLRQRGRSVPAQWQGRPVMVACTDRDTLADWWDAQPDRDPEPPTVHELPFRQIIGLWASTDVELLVDPRGADGVLVPVAGARQHFGMGPVVPEGDGREPLPFVGFSSGRMGVRVPLIIMVLCVGILVAVLRGANPLLLPVALAGVVAAIVLGRRSFGEMAAARRATRRLAASDRLKASGSAGDG